MSNKDEIELQPPNPWHDVAVVVCQNPLIPVDCPICGASAVSGEWNLLNVPSRDALVDLHCSACGRKASVRIELPEGAPAFYPVERFERVAELIANEVEFAAARLLKHVEAMPAATFTAHPFWEEAKWSATTYKWHPMSQAPPILGLVFDNGEAGLEIFRTAEQLMSHEDRYEEIRVAVIEGTVPGKEERPGYSVQICADAEAFAARGTPDDFVVDPMVVPFLGQWNRHFLVTGESAMLARFKEEFRRHHEFLLAPAVRHADGKLYIEPKLGIIKKAIHFRELSDIKTPDDPDFAALVLPHLIVTPSR